MLIFAGVFKKTKNQEKVSENKLNYKTLLKQLKKLERSWTGHFADIEAKHCTIRLTKLTLRGKKRNRGKQKISWRKEINFVGNEN